MGDTLNLTSSWDGNKSSRILFDDRALGQSDGLGVSVYGASRVNLDKEKAIEVRDYLIERFPLTPAHGFKVGDVVQVLLEDRRYSSGSPDVLDAPVSRSIGRVTAVDGDSVLVTDAGGNAGGFRFRGEHALLAETLRAYPYDLADLGYLPHAEPKAEPEFKVGDRVKIVQSPYASPCHAEGVVGEVTEIRTGSWPFRVTTSAGDCRDCTFSFSADQIEIVTFAVGDRVRVISTRYAGATRQIGAIGRVAAPGRRGAIAVTIDAEDTGERWNFLPGEIELAPLDEPGDPVGSIVYVTGHTHDDPDLGEHGFTVGEEVEIIAGPFDDAHTNFKCRSTSTGEEWYVYEHDLDVEPPFVPLPVGTVVRILDDGSENRPRHYLIVGSLAEIVSSGPEYCVLRGAHTRTAGTITQSVSLKSFEVVTP